MFFQARSLRAKTLPCRQVPVSKGIPFGGLPRIAGFCVLLLASALLVLAAGRGGVRTVKGQPAKTQAAAISPGIRGGLTASIRPKALASYGKLPLTFEPNLGQADAQVRFISRAPGYTLFLTNHEAVFSLQPKPQPNSAAAVLPSANKAGADDSQEFADNVLNRAPNMQPQDAVLRVQLVKANKNATVTGLDELPGKTNYIRGNDPAKWTTNISNYGKIRYNDVFRGIDLVYYGNQGRLEYDFVLSPGADTQSIGLNFSGARNLHIDRPTGDLVLNLGREELRFHKPVAYQNEADAAAAETDGGKHLIAADYILDSHNHVNFALGEYDHSKALVIDPTLSYSTYLGGASNDYATSIAVDSTGSAYVVGYTNSVNFPTTSGAYQTTCSGGCSGTTVDAFVSKLDPTGSFLVYSTYLGGAGNDYGNGIVLDASGDAYIVGQTFSSNFPTTKGAFQTLCGGGSCSGGDVFVTELNSAGSGLVYSTYLGGTGKNQGNAITLDASDNAYVTGYTQSLKFPTTPGAFQPTCKCSQTVAFATELNTTGSALVYSTYLGGSKGDEGYAIVLDSSNNAYLTGYTHSTNFPTTTGAFQTTLSANTAAFVTKLNSTGTALVYSTYLGGGNSNSTPCETCAVDIAVDSSGSAYVCGLTAESNFPITPGAFQSTFKSSSNGHDAFVTKFNPSGTGLSFSTYVGGSGDDGATGILLDSSGNVWIKGNTKSTDFPLTPGAFQTASGGDFDSYVSELDPTGSTLLYSTYLGGSGAEFGGATRMLALDTQTPANVYVTGYTNSTNFPVTSGALQTSLAGNNDAFVSKFAPSPNVGLSPGLNFGFQNDGTTSPPQNLTVTNTGNTNLTVTSVTIVGPNSKDFSETNTCGTVAPQATCTITVTFTPTISGNENASVSVTDNAPGSPQLASLTGLGVGNGPAVVLSPTSLTYGTQLIGTGSAPQPVLLSNIGNSALTIVKIAPTAGFSQTNNCGSSVAAGATCTISVTFKPTKPNVVTGSVTVTDNAPGSPQTVTLTGTGTYVILTPASLNFGTVPVGSSSSPQVANFTNTAKFALPIKSLMITGADSADYSDVSTCGTSVASGASCTITVTFKPTATGVRTASVSVTDGGGGSPQTVALTGTGQ